MLILYTAIRGLSPKELLRNHSIYESEVLKVLDSAEETSCFELQLVFAIEFISRTRTLRQ